MGLLFTFRPGLLPAEVLGPERTRLLEAAVRVFARNDYQKASLRLIAADAKVTAAMVNYYFGGKEQLFSTVLDATFKHLEELVSARTEPRLTFKQRLQGFVEGHELFATTLTDAAELMVRSAFRPGEQGAAERYAPLRALAGEIMTTAVKSKELTLGKELDARRASEHLLGQVELLVIQRVQARRQPAADVPSFRADEVVRLFLKGVSGR